MTSYASSDKRFVLPDGTKMTAAELEAFLLDQLKKEPGDRNTLWHLALLYRKIGRRNDAEACYERIRSQFRGQPNQEAAFWLGVGAMMEQSRDFEAAVEAYRLVLSLQPTDHMVWYFGNNNIGYSLAKLGRFKEAEGYCRTAIQINDKQYNAHKNLGLSLEGQGRYVEAAQSYICAVKAYPRDIRAFCHLEELMREHPEISRDIPDIELLLLECRNLVTRRGNV